MQRTEVVDDASWMMGFLDIIDPAVDSIKRLFNMDKVTNEKPAGNGDIAGTATGSGFNLDAFIRQKLLLDPSKLEFRLDPSGGRATSKSTP